MAGSVAGPWAAQRPPSHWLLGFGPTQIRRQAHLSNYTSLISAPPLHPAPGRRPAKDKKKGFYWAHSPVSAGGPFPRRRAFRKQNHALQVLDELPSDPRPRGAPLRRRAPCLRRVPSPRWGASRGHATTFLPRSARPAAHWPAGEGLAVRRAARGARARRRRGCAARSIARQAPGSTRWGAPDPGSRLPNLQKHHFTARRPVPRKANVQGSARRRFPHDPAPQGAASARARSASPTGLG
jgi:hypothetical protein